MKVTTKFHGAAVMRTVQERKIEPLMKCGALVEREAKLSMKTGGGKAHEPSAPGTPPHSHSPGGLRNSITHAYDASVKTVIVGPTIQRDGFPYGKVHEYGSKFHPLRQFMHPALARAKVRFSQFFKGAIHK